jgi:hypothetical protein
MLVYTIGGESVGLAEFEGKKYTGPDVSPGRVVRAG